MRKKIKDAIAKFKILWALPLRHDQLRQQCDAIELRLKDLESAQELVERASKQEDKEISVKLRNATPHQRVRWLEATDGGRVRG